LRVVPIEIPPLRDRREDIEPLARALLARVGARQGRSLRLSPDAMRALLMYDWPGNARELENALAYAVAVSRGQTILPDDLPSFAARRPRSHPTTAEEGAPLEPAAATGREPLHPPSVEEVRRLRATLEAHHWRRDAAARSLGISRTTLWRKMREAGLE
jgi:DNA-binding NtrC family response regulator